MSRFLGYQGFFFEDLKRGQVIVHRRGRTVTFQENLVFSQMLLNTSPLHFDREYMEFTEFKQPLLVTTLVLGITFGIASEDFKNVAREVEVRNLQMRAPVFDGDTLHVTTEVMETHEVADNREVGAVVARHRTYKSGYSTLVMQVDRELLLYRREHHPRWRLNPPPSYPESHESG
ncbi:MAG: MaoC family dehydratase [Thaumarchaeota archaeon]|nr:MaoC family dehydratase [Candidatus Calditenuaceae archaeon]MDW8041478.1 MaoC family dehydratase [Nitrososphaerota archaeon]